MLFLQGNKIFYVNTAGTKTSTFILTQNHYCKNYSVLTCLSSCLSVTRYLTHTELSPLRAPLIPMEHCTTRFFDQCDVSDLGSRNYGARSDFYCLVTEEMWSTLHLRLLRMNSYTEIRISISLYLSMWSAQCVVKIKVLPFLFPLMKDIHFLYFLLLCKLFYEKLYKKYLYQSGE